VADITVDASVSSLLYKQAVRLGPVWVSTSTAYVIYRDDSADLVYQKTADGGASWASPVSVHTGSLAALSIWYDRWTPGHAGTVIHMAYGDTVTDLVHYRSLDTSDDSLGTEITVFTGVSLLDGDWTNRVVDVVRAVGGNLYIGFWADSNGGELGFYRSTDDGAAWTSRAQLADGNATDGILLMPGNETDEDDIWCIYWDRSADEISLKVYDNSGDSWAETSIATSMADDADYYDMSAAPRHSDGHVILAAWSEHNSATADLRVWDIDGSGSITAKTNVLTDTNLGGQVAVFIDQQSDDIYVAYVTAWGASASIKYKKSTDGGVTWGTEQSYSESTSSFNALWAGISVGDDGGRFQPVYFSDTLDDLFVNLVNEVYIAAKVNTLRAAYVGARVDAVPSSGSAVT